MREEISDRARFVQAFFLGVFFCAAAGVGFAVGPPPFAIAKLSDAPPAFLAGFQNARTLMGYAAAGGGILSGMAALLIQVYIRRRRRIHGVHAVNVIDRHAPPNDADKPTSPAASGSASR